MTLKKNFFYALILLLAILCLFVLGEQNRNWTQNADQELTLAYNALLINSGFNQEYLDHPGFFTIQLLALLIKIKYYLKISPIKDLSDLNLSSNFFAGFSDIVETAHFLAFFCTAILLLAIFIYCSLKLNDSFSAFLITLALLSSNAIIIHYIALRTEMIAALLLMSSLLIFFRSANHEDRNAVSLYFALILFFFALLNKTQIIFYSPLYFFWIINFRPIANKANYVLFLEKTEIKEGLLACLLCYLFFMLTAKGISIAFNFIYISSLFGLVYFYWRTNGGNLAKQIYSFSLCYLIAYLTTFLFVNYTHGYQKELFVLIFNPIEMSTYLNDGVKELSWSEMTFFQFINSFYKSLLSPSFGTLTSLNSVSFLFYLNLFILCIKKATKVAKVKVLISLVSFSLIIIITSSRGIDHKYFIFSEFLLIIALIDQIATLKFKKLFSVLIFFSLLSFNFNTINKQILNNSSNIIQLCTDSYISDWHKRINLEAFYTACKNSR